MTAPIPSYTSQAPDKAQSMGVFGKQERLTPEWAFPPHLLQPQLLFTKEKNITANLSFPGAGDTLMFLEAWTATAHKHNRHYRAECHHNCSLKVPTSWAQLSLDS